MAAPPSVLPSALPAYPELLARLQAFRAGLHGCCTRRADALVDLADALLSAQGPVASLPHLSLEPAHRRGWGSLYAALACGRIDAERLRDLLVGCLPRRPVVVRRGRDRLAALRRRGVCCVARSQGVPTLSAPVSGPTARALVRRMRRPADDS